LRQTAISLLVMTLHDRVSGKTRNIGFSQTFLLKQTEELVVHALLLMAEWGVKVKNSGLVQTQFF
jgi:hypothetical protein